HAVADRPEIFADMTPEEILANFGGRKRLARLSQLFQDLAAGGCELFIVSIGFRDSILPHLTAVGLVRHFRPENVFGQDSEALRCRGFVKGRLISDIMADPSRLWSPQDALFVDDCAAHIEAAASVCEVLRVVGNGLSAAELDAVEAIARRGPLIETAGLLADPSRLWRLSPDEATLGAGCPSAAGAWFVVVEPTK
ncbi:unnamed protein product, partial [Polarella glacialis]